MSSAVTAYVTFTVFSQMAVGALIAMVIADFLAKGKDEAKFLRQEHGSLFQLPLSA